MLGIAYVVLKYNEVKYCTLKSSVSKIPIAFHNGFKYGYHFIIKELAEEFKKQFKKPYQFQ